MSRGVDIVCCTSDSALAAVLASVPAAVVQVRLLPLPSMFPCEISDALGPLPYEVACVVAPPAAVERLLTASGQENARLGQTLVFAGQQLLGRLDPAMGTRPDLVIGLLRAGLSPRLPGQARGQGGWEDDNDPYSVLGVTPSASADEIRSAWRRRMTEHHPDRFMLADEHRRRLALARSQRFNAAYKAIQRLRAT